MNRLLFLTIVLACIFGVSNAALADTLKWYDSFALNNIWRAMTYNTYYRFITAYICNSYATYLADAAGLFTADDITAAGYDAKELCNTGLTKVYNAVWYRYDNRVFTWGDDDLYNYTI